MHEVSLAQHLIDLCQEAAAGQPVLSIQVRLGQGSCVAAESLQFCFEVVARGTSAQGARLDIESATGTEFQLVSLEVE
ncbi:hydrogenase maturation nickel metallochaperone HypA [bacterium]|nr:hydrogenase maturation nickel metallochaperone HypA [bacterium]